MLIQGAHMYNTVDFWLPSVQVLCMGSVMHFNMNKQNILHGLHC